MGQVMNIGPMGGGGVIFKRKFRWKFTLNFSCGGQSFNFTAPNVATGGRPKISIDTTEVHYMGAKIKIPGEEVDYEPLQFTFYDLTGLDLTAFYIWIHSFMRLSNPKAALTPNASVYGTVLLEMLDGCGQVIETWILEECWPSEVDFGELDMASSEAAMINLTLVYNLVTLNPNKCSGLLIPTCCGISTDSIPSTTSISVVPLPQPPAGTNESSLSGTYHGQCSNLQVLGLSGSISFVARTDGSNYLDANYIQLQAWVNLTDGTTLYVEKDRASSNPTVLQLLGTGIGSLTITSPVISYDVNVNVTYNNGSTCQDAYSS